MAAKYSILPAEACFDKRITPQQLRVLAIISYYGGSRGRGCWPSYTRLCEDAGISRRLLITYIKHLCECGYVVKEERSREDGSRSTNNYRVILDIVIDMGGGDAQLHRGSDVGLIGGGDAQLHPIEKNNKTEQKNINKENIKKKSSKIPLGAWEEKTGAELRVEMLMAWVKENNLDPVLITRLIGEFREKVSAGGNLYADFAAAFKVWLRSGYLSLTLAAAQSKSVVKKDNVVFHNKGVHL